MTKGTKILITILSILVVGGGATVGIVVLPQMFVKESIIEKFDMANDSLGQFFDLCEEEGISLNEWTTMAPDNFLGYDSYYDVVRTEDVTSKYRTAAGTVKIEGDYRISTEEHSDAWDCFRLNEIYLSDSDKFEYEPKSREESDEDSDDVYKEVITEMRQGVFFKSSKDYKEGRKKIKKYFEGIADYSCSYRNDDDEVNTIYIYDIGKVKATIPYRVNPDKPLWNDDENVDGEVIVREITYPIYIMAAMKDTPGRYSDEYVEGGVVIEYFTEIGELGRYLGTPTEKFAKEVDSITEQLFADIPKHKVTVYKTVAEYEKKTGEKVKGISQEKLKKEKEFEKIYEVYKQFIDSEGYHSDIDFKFVDIDNNGVPELFTENVDYTYPVLFYIENDKVQVLECGNYTAMHYCKVDGKIFMHQGGHMTLYDSVYRLADGHMEELFSGSYDVYGEASNHYVNEQAVSKEEYDRMFEAAWNYDFDDSNIISENEFDYYDSLEEAKEAWLEQL